MLTREEVMDALRDPTPPLPTRRRVAAAPSGFDSNVQVLSLADLSPIRRSNDQLKKPWMALLNKSHTGGEGKRPHGIPGASGATVPGAVPLSPEALAKLKQNQSPKKGGSKRAGRHVDTPTHSKDGSRSGSHAESREDVADDDEPSGNQIGPLNDVLDRDQPGASNSMNTLAYYKGMQTSLD